MLHSDSNRSEVVQGNRGQIGQLVEQALGRLAQPAREEAELPGTDGSDDPSAQLAAVEEPTEPTTSTAQQPPVAPPSPQPASPVSTTPVESAAIGESLSPVQRKAALERLLEAARGNPRSDGAVQLSLTTPENEILVVAFHGTGAITVAQYTPVSVSSDGTSTQTYSFLDGQTGMVQEGRGVRGNPTFSSSQVDDILSALVEFGPSGEVMLREEPLGRWSYIPVPGMAVA